MQTFAIAPAGARPLWLLVPIVFLLLTVLGVLTASLLGGYRARFEVSPSGVRLRGDLYGRLIPAESLVTDSARRVDLTAERTLRPTMRTVGTGMPGYQAGWFRLANGEKALLYLTDRTRAVYVPTRAGYSLIVSPADPDAFLIALRGIRPGT